VGLFLVCHIRSRRWCAFAKADTAYAPLLCETWEPMVLAAEMVLMKLR
jgi:hypothetical protein